MKILTRDKVSEVKLLLDHHSQREAAKLAGVARGTVTLIANGQRPDYEALKIQRVAEAAGPPIDPGDVPPGTLIHCPGCNQKCYAPCYLCHIRGLKEAERAAAKGRRKQRELHELRTFLTRQRDAALAHAA